MAAGATTARTPSLHYWRTQRALSQQELADHAALHVMSVYRGEHEQPMRLAVIRRLAAVLDVAPADLMRQPPAERQELGRVAEERTPYGDPEPPV